MRLSADLMAVLFVRCQSAASQSWCRLRTHGVGAHVAYPSRPAVGDMLWKAQIINVRGAIFPAAVDAWVFGVRRLTWLIVTSFTFLAVLPGRAGAQEWSGYYIGAHGGYRWVDLDLTTPAYSFLDGTGGTVQIPARNEKFSINAGIVGVHGGYNFLLSPSWLLGVEADISIARGNRTRTARFTTTHTETTTNSSCGDCDEQQPTEITQTITTLQQRFSQVKLGWQGTLRARLGFIGGATLFYSTAGLLRL